MINHLENSKITNVLTRCLRYKRKPSSKRLLSITAEKQPALYQRQPPWWARWTYALVACDLIMTASIIEVTWSHWTQKISTEKAEKTESSPQSAESYTLRPIWQRLALSVAHLGIGVGIAVLLIGSQTRVVRTLLVLPPALPPSTKTKPGLDLRNVFIQGPQHLGQRGRMFPISKCTLDVSKEGTEMVMRVDGQRGHWWIGLEKALINGKETSAAGAREGIFKIWSPKRSAGRWASGPATKLGKPLKNENWK